MTSAGAALQEQLIARFQNLAELTGIYDGPPARAAYPYLVVDTSVESDWSTKTERGREVFLSLTLWDDRPARLQQLVGTIETIMEQSLRPDGWQAVSCHFRRKRIVQRVAGPWAGALDYRARFLALA